jgi:hypothetical protein
MQRALKSVFYGGLVAGTIDIAAAAAISSLGFGVVLRAVASGLLGRAAFQGGPGVAVLGMVLQWVMSWIIAGVFVTASVKFPSLTRRWVASGVVYGVIVFFVMNYGVLPLSAVGHIAHFKPLSFVENLLAMVLFGLIIASIASRFLDGERRRGVAVLRS